MTTQETTASATPDGVIISFPDNGSSLPSTVTLVTDDRNSFEGCPVEKKGDRILVYVSREKALTIDPGSDVEVNAAGMEGVVEWPYLPAPGSGANRIGAKVKEDTGTPAQLEGYLPDAGAIVLPPKGAPTPEPSVEPAPPITTVAPEPPVTYTTQTSFTPTVAPSNFLVRLKTQPVLLRLLIGGGLLLLLLPVLLWFVIHKVRHIPTLPGLSALSTLTHTPAPTQQAATSVTPPSPPTTTPPAPAPTSAGNVAPNLTELSVTEVVQQAPNAAAIGGEGERRLDGGKPDDGLRLMEAAADRGDTHAMDRLGNLYDPAHFKAGGPIPAADEQEAARYYQKAAKAGDTSMTADRAKLQAALKQRADDGDSDAALTLESYFK